MKIAYCCDLDGTLTTTEILPCIAAELGVADEIATLTRATMEGLIPFEASFRLRCLILKQVQVEKIREIVHSIPIHQEISDFLRQKSSNSFVVTGNLDLWVESKIRQLGVGLFASEGIFKDGALCIRKVLNKADAVSELRGRGYDRIIAIGDGANDVSMFEASDVSIAYGGVHTPVAAARLAADYVIHDGVTLCRLLRAL